MKIHLLLALLITPLLVFTQQNTKIKQTYFSAGLNIYQGLIFENKINQEQINGSYLPNLCIGIYHVENLKNKNNFVKIGLKHTRYIEGYRFNVWIDDYGNKNINEINYGDFYNEPISQLSFSFMKKVWIKNNFAISPSFGLDFFTTDVYTERTFSYRPTNTSSNSYSKNYFSIEYSNTNNLFFGIHTKIDFKIIKKNTFNHWGYSFAIHYSPQKIAKGWYSFANTQYNGRGEVHATINHLSLEFFYYITRKKNRSDLAEYNIGL